MESTWWSLLIATGIGAAGSPLVTGLLRRARDRAESRRDDASAAQSVTEAATRLLSEYEELWSSRLTDEQLRVADRIEAWRGRLAGCYDDTDPRCRAIMAEVQVEIDRLRNG